jgi:hypothetical protein
MPIRCRLSSDLPRRGEEALSSAILYGAIVVIWAGVLIPRWLRRESSVAASDSASVPVSDSASSSASDVTVDAEVVADPVPAAAPAEAVASRSASSSSESRARDPEHARVIGARRRLLGMLLALAIGSGVLAVMKLAAWWVVLPPSVMLLGYLALLREASRADAERRSATRTTVSVPAAAPVGAAVGASSAGAVVAEDAAAVVAPVVAAPVAAPAPDAEIIDITGRVGEEFYDQVADAKLRAVGD